MKHIDELNYYLSIDEITFSLAKMTLQNEHNNIIIISGDSVQKCKLTNKVVSRIRETAKYNKFTLLCFNRSFGFVQIYKAN